MSGSLALEAKGASLARNGVAILRDLTFGLRAGEWAFLYGPPGAGKTSLLRLAAGDLPPTAGAIDRAGRAAIVLHETKLDDSIGALDLLARAFGDAADARGRAQALLGDLGLEAYANHEPFRLSRGHYRRLAIAQALASRPSLLCLDDPFSPMDRTARARTADVLRAAARETGVAILMVSNDPLDGLRYGDRILLMSAGPAARIVASPSNAPRPDAATEEHEADTLFQEISAALWDAGGA